MKKIVVVLLSVYVLSACQTTAINSNESNDVNLGVAYSGQPQSSNKSANLNTQLGAGYISNGNYDRALLKLNKALRMDPNHALAHSYLGVLYSRLERPEKAKRQFSKARQLSPNDSSIMNNYAIFLCEQKQFDQAQQLFNRVLNNPLYVNRANSYQSAAWCAWENNNLELAEEHYRKALELNSNSTRSLLGLAKINYKKEKYQYAWSYFERFYQYSAADADALWLGINILDMLVKPDKNLLSSFKLQLKSKYPDSDEAKWFYQGKQEY